MALKANMPPGSIARSSAGLREALFQNMEALRNGTMDPRTAIAAAQTAKQIIGTVRLDIEYAREVRAGAGDAIEAAQATLLTDGEADAGPPLPPPEPEPEPPRIAAPPPPRTVERLPDIPPEIEVRFEEPKNRRCLRCQTIFLSVSAGNRMCDDCRKRPESSERRQLA